MFPVQYIKFTKEQLKRAQHVDLVEFLRSRGENVYREGKHYVWDKHDSIRIMGFRWFRNSNQESGAAVKFVEHFFNLHFVDAVKLLLEDDTLPQSNCARITNQSKSLFVPPQKNDNERRALAYLTKSRYLDLDIVHYFMEKGMIYEDIKHNAVFVGFNSQRRPVNAFLRGTNTFHQKPFKAITPGSDMKYPFQHIGSSDRLYVTEGAIDLLSYICLNRHEDWTAHSYLSLGGLHDTALKQCLKENTHIREIVFATDNDRNSTDVHGMPINPGQDFALRFSKLYERDYITKIEPPVYKDWNQDLKIKRMER